ncbi:MAG: hypothetical protein NVS2B9_16370 [Myxococcales bacterium]
MKFTRNPPWLVELFESALEGTDAVRRTMFGSACAFVGGNLACGVFGAGVFVRLSGPDRARLLAQPGAAPFDPMGGRPMREYALLPPALFEDERALQGWVGRALDYAGTLPPKKARAKAKARAKKKPPAARSKG